jgi:DNA-binding CsgD family transcriptional regulator
VAHLILSFYLLALVAGTTSLSQTFLIWQRYRKPVLRGYALFQLSLYLILLSFLVDLYARTVSVTPAALAADIVWVLQAGGSLCYVVVAPGFYDALIGLPRRRWKAALFLAVDVLAVGGAAASVAAPSVMAIKIALSALLFAMILYGLVLIAARLGSIGDPTLRRALAIFLGLSVLFFPLMYADIALSFVPWLSFLSFMDNLTLPAYFLILNCLTVVFGLRYMNRPAYIERDRLTDYFVEAFRISAREKEIIGLLIDGRGARQIAERLFISEKTVENHVYNIYQKLRVRNRVQMFQLIRGNSIE